MSHTLETAIGIPILLLSLSSILAAGPVLYSQVSADAKYRSAILDASLRNDKTFTNIRVESAGQFSSVNFGSPERIHFYLRTVEDSIAILKEGAK